MRAMRLVLPLLIVLSILPAAADDWARFRGPNGTGIAKVTGLPTEFGPAKNVVWKAATPAGHSSPVLAPTRIFMTGIDGEKLVVLALDRATGKELWRVESLGSYSGACRPVAGHGLGYTAMGYIAGGGAVRPDGPGVANDTNAAWTDQRPSARPSAIIRASSGVPE